MGRCSQAPSRSHTCHIPRNASRPGWAVQFYTSFNIVFLSSSLLCIYGDQQLHIADELQDALLRLFQAQESFDQVEEALRGYRTYSSIQASIPYETSDPSTVTIQSLLSTSKLLFSSIAAAAKAYRVGESPRTASLSIPTRPWPWPSGLPSLAAPPTTTTSTYN
jgi:hypothetical protein